MYGARGWKSRRVYQGNAGMPPAGHHSWGLGAKGRWDGESLAFRKGSRGAGAQKQEGVAWLCCCSRGRAALHRWGGQLASGLAPTAPPATPPPLAGIIDLSQVPHLPVLVPPTPGTPATAMDRLAYLPTAPQHFSSRLSSSPLSPGNTPAPVLGQDPCVHRGWLGVLSPPPKTGPGPP